jgi:L-fuconolactonase
LIRVDAHQHYWRLSRGDYDWLTPEQGSLYRDFEPEHLREAFAECQIRASVLIQAAATEAETLFLLERAREHASIAGVVGWVDFEASNVRDRVQALVDNGAGKLKGLRPMVQSIDDAEWLRKPSLDAAFAAAIDSNLTFDALVTPRHLDALNTRMRRHPTLRAVLDHGGKPDITLREIDTWAAQVESLARSSSLHCKLSGFLTQAPSGAGVAELDDYVAHIFACFGAERVMWGSDWPVVTVRASYRQWLELALELIHRHAPGSEPDVLGQNAIRFYRLEL